MNLPLKNNVSLNTVKLAAFLKNQGYRACNGGSNRETGSKFYWVRPKTGVQNLARLEYNPGEQRFLVHADDQKLKMLIESMVQDSLEEVLA